jgi:hypothetical protein
MSLGRFEISQQNPETGIRFNARATSENCVALNNPILFSYLQDLKNLQINFVNL